MFKHILLLPDFNNTLYFMPTRKYTLYIYKFLHPNFFIHIYTCKFYIMHRGSPCHNQYVKYLHMKMSINIVKYTYLYNYSTLIKYLR